MLDFNKKLYARDADEMKAAEARGMPINGLYEPHNGGFKLFDEHGALTAYISRQRQATMVVSAYTFHEDGFDRYMQALTTSTEKWLGFPNDVRLAQEQEAIDAMREFDLEKEQGARWVIYNADEYMASGDGAGFWSDEDGWTVLSGATRYDKELPHQEGLPLGHSQMLEIGTMQDFRLMVIEYPNDSDVDQTPILFHCFAEDLAHAIEQAVDAYPGCRVLGMEGEGAGDSPMTFTASWTDRSRSPNVKHAISGVAWWRDEKSEYDAYTLRVLYAPDGRKLGGPIVSEMTDWRVECDGVAAAADNEPEDGPSPF